MKFRKVIFLSALLIVFSCMTVLADTYREEEYGNGYGYAKLEVDSSGGLRNCHAWTGSKPYNEAYTYNVKLLTTYQDGDTLEEETGFQQGYAFISHSYEWAEDYYSSNYVRDGIYIQGRFYFSGS